jgi:hypothetical protein
VAHHGERDLQTVLIPTGVAASQLEIESCTVRRSGASAVSAASRKLTAFCVSTSLARPDMSDATCSIMAARFRRLLPFKNGSDLRGSDFGRGIGAFAADSKTISRTNSCPLAVICPRVRSKYETRGVEDLKHASVAATHRMPRMFDGMLNIVSGHVDAGVSIRIGKDAVIFFHDERPVQNAGLRHVSK